ncbi:hypothetical protein KOR42_21700 [Thalassoglobus neptunius]|uniref:Uncharacterized protein n=2 Tax=Thalassoglobus neptunius TaxID=1938619 RepID=A0A5C5X7A5_9PLAN|nr:hypothetical protein KOR42_21700 [Thalassoglobus neptunius]
MQNTESEMEPSPSGPDSQKNNHQTGSKTKTPTHPIVASIEQMIILIGFYILSIGPMYWQWIAAKDVDGFHFIEVLYRPLWVLAGEIPALGDWLNWYVRLWIF